MIPTEKAIEWWYSMTIEERNDIEKKYGYFGHDIDSDLHDITYFYNSENENLNP